VKGFQTLALQQEPIQTLQKATADVLPYCKLSKSIYIHWEGPWYVDV